MLTSLPAGQAQQLTGRQFFPHLITSPFHSALAYAFVFATAACVIAAIASLLRGGKYHYEPATTPAGAPTGVEPVEDAA